MLRLLLLTCSLAGTAYCQIDVRDVPGIDCSGHSDSSSALNRVFQTISNRKVTIPSGCEIRADSQIVIQGQTSFIIEGNGDRPDVPGGPSIFGCNGTAGAVLRINRSGFWTLRHFGIFTTGVAALCPLSNFTRGIDIDNSGTDGFTTTHGNIEHMGFTTNVQGGAVPGYRSVNIIGHPNTEHMQLRDNWFQGQNSPGSCAIWLEGVNSDNDLAEGNSIAGFYQGICHVGGNMRIVQNHFGNVGNFSVFGSGGAVIFFTYVVSGPLYIAYNEESDGGPFINSNNDQPATCCRGMNIIGNVIGISDIGPNQYPINLGTGQIGPYILEGNDIYIFPKATTKTVIGSDSQANCQYGPLGTLIDIGNFNSFPGNSAGWSGCANGPDFQYGHAQIQSNCTPTNACSSN